jgi:type IV secretion system protein VirB9
MMKNILYFYRNFFAKITIFLCHFLIIMAILQGKVFASQSPRYLGTEKKFRSYIFNPNEVYRYLGHYTYQGFIEFEKDETISTITMGDPSLWLFEHLGNRLFLKPVGENNSQTNMTVITSKRIYHFELTAKEAKDINDPDLVFVAKFVYQDDQDKNILEFPRVMASDEPDLRDLSLYNFNYQYTGQGSITPSKVFDNGEFTYFEFSHKNSEIPAIFSVDAAGFESLVNFRAAGNYIIVERTGSQFTLRNGSDIVCVYNMGRVAGSGSVAPPSSSLRAPPTNFAPPQAASFGAPANERNLTYPSPQFNSAPPPPESSMMNLPLPGTKKGL